MSLETDIESIDRFIAQLLSEFPLLNDATGFTPEKLDESTFVLSTASALTQAMPLQPVDYFLLGMTTDGGSALVATTSMSVGTFTTTFRIFTEVLLFLTSAKSVVRTRIPIKANQQLYVSTSTQAQVTVFIGKPSLATS